MAFLAIDRKSGLFDKETTDQLNVRINDISRNTLSLKGVQQTRAHYYDDVVSLPITFKVGVINNASLKYGRVGIVNFSFRVEQNMSIIGKIQGYESPYDCYVNIADTNGNNALASISKDGTMRFATASPGLSEEAAFYFVYIV